MSPTPKSTKRSKKRDRDPAQSTVSSRLDNLRKSVQNREPESEPVRTESATESAPTVVATESESVHTELEPLPTLVLTSSNDPFQQVLNTIAAKAERSQPPPPSPPSEDDFHIPIQLPGAVPDSIKVMVDAETEYFEKTSSDTIPTSVSAPNSTADANAISVLDLADQIGASPQFRDAAATLAEQTLSKLLFDATTDNRVILTLNGQSIQRYKADWIEYNSGRQTDKIPFSTYLSQRLNTCREHSSDKSIYLRAENIQQLDKLAGDNFSGANQLVNWITKTLTPLASVDGAEKMTFEPIPAKIYERFVDRCYSGETPVQLMNKVIREALAYEVGL